MFAGSLHFRLDGQCKPSLRVPVAPASRYAHREPKKALLDTATCARNPQGMCNILRIDVLKRFSLRQGCPIGDGYCALGRQNRFWIGLGDSHAPPQMPSATPCRKNCHKPSRSPCSHGRSKCDGPTQRKGHVSAPFSMLFAGRNKRNKLTTRSRSGGTPWPSERLRTPSRAGQCRAGAGRRARESAKLSLCLRRQRRPYPKSKWNNLR